MDATSDRDDLRPLYQAILGGDVNLACKVTGVALSRNVDPLFLVNQYMSPAMDEAGRRFEQNIYFVPELLLASRAMKMSMSLLRPLLEARGTEPIGRVVLGTVRGDLHDIGKNLVAALLQGGGFEVIDIGVNLTPERFVSAVQEHRPHILGLSALLTTTMMAMRTTIEALEREGIRSNVRVMVGGAPVTADFAGEIGADAFGANAVAAVARARELICSPAA
jgi:methylmalonyl-CoA mutase cobalamin-binding domain/chain